jgi:anti-sigma factor RsiW
MSNPRPRPITNLLRGLLGPAGPELTCEQCFEYLDCYVDVELAGRDADAAVPGMRAHLEGCPACAEDHDSLHALVGSERRPHEP